MDKSPAAGGGNGKIQRSKEWDYNGIKYLPTGAGLIFILPDPSSV